MIAIAQKIFQEQFERCYDNDVNLSECFITAYDQLKTKKEHTIHIFIKSFRYYDIFEMRNLLNSYSRNSFRKKEIEEHLSTLVDMIGRHTVMETINMFYVEINEKKESSAGSYF